MVFQKVHSHLLSMFQFVFIKSGHSCLPCNRTFGLIKKALNVPTCWVFKRLLEYHCNLHQEEIPNCGHTVWRLFWMSAASCRISLSEESTVPQECQFAVDKSYLKDYILKINYTLDNDPSVTLMKVFLMKERSRWTRTRLDISRAELTPKYQWEGLSGGKGQQTSKSFAKVREKCPELAISNRQARKKVKPSRKREKTWAIPY